MEEKSKVQESEFVCVWEEVRRKKADLYMVQCLGSQVNPWKIMKKRGITLVQLFTVCPFCGKKVLPKFVKEGEK